MPPPHPFTAGGYAAWHKDQFPADDPLVERVDEMRAELLKVGPTNRDSIERLAHIEHRLDEAVSLLARLEMRIESGSAGVQRLGSAVADHTAVLDQTRDAVRMLQLEQRNARRRRDAAILLLAGGVLLASIGMVVVSRL